MKELLKKYWFVLVIGVLLVAMVIYMSLEQFSKIVPSKKVDGKDVIFQYQEQYVTADDIYDDIFEIDGERLIITLYENLVYRNAIAPDNDLISEAKLASENLIVRAKQQYGERYKEALKTILLPYGYSKGVDDLNDYFLTEFIKEKVILDYIKDDQTLWETYRDDLNPRLVSHILIKMDNSEKPTAEELKRLEDVKAKLAESEADFHEIAKQYSEDAGSKDSGGKVGLTDKNNSAGFVEEFHKAIYSVGINEKTDWVKTSFGYHLIFVESNSLDDITTADNFLESYFKYYPNLPKLITKATAANSDIEISGNPELEAKVKAYYDVKEAK